MMLPTIKSLGLIRFPATIPHPPTQDFEPILLTIVSFFDLKLSSRKVLLLQQQHQIARAHPLS